MDIHREKDIRVHTEKHRDGGISLCVTDTDAPGEIAFGKNLYMASIFLTVGQLELMLAEARQPVPQA